MLLFPVIRYNKPFKIMPRFYDFGYIFLKIVTWHKALTLLQLVC